MICTPAETLHQQGGESEAQEQQELQEIVDSSRTLLVLLEKFVGMVAPHAVISTQVQPAFRSVLRDLCEKAPQIARFLAATVRECSEPNSCRQSSIKGQQPNFDSDARPATKSKSATDKDLSYRPSKPPQAKSRQVDESKQPEDGSKFHHSAFPQACAPAGIQPSVQEEEEGTTTQDGNIETPGVKSSDDVDDCGEDVSWLLNQQQSITLADSVCESEGIADDDDALKRAMDQEPEKATAETRAAPVASGAKEWRPVTVESAVQSELLRRALPDTAPATPPMQVRDALPSPPTEEISRGTIPTSVDSIPSSPRSTTGSSSTPVTSTRDMILEAVRVIHQLNKHPDGVPREVHSMILQTLWEDHGETSSVASLGEWSDGCMWMRVLEAGGSENQTATIFNMLEYMGAWKWYDRQIQLSQATVRTKKNKPVDHRGAATHVLNKLQNLQTSTEQPGKWIQGLGRLDLPKEEDESGISPQSCNSSITEQARQLQRKRISVQLSRGQKLSTKIVKELGLGILFRQDIWEITKRNAQQLDTLISYIQADPKRVRLFQILSPQLELLINRGQPDLQSLLTSLKAEDLVSEEEYRELRATFALEAEALPKGSLDAAVDRLRDDVRSKVLGKRKLEDDDGVAVNGGVELSCDIFDRLRGDNWFDAWLLMAGMQMSDKPSFVRYGPSVDLDQTERFGRSGTRRVSRPLAGWRKTIDKFRSDGQPRKGQRVPPVHLCPLFIARHFTLLEVNEQVHTIFHYDSMASEAIISGRTELSRVGKIVQEEFGYLRFKYLEAATPQQNDGSSCGSMFVRNFARRANGWSVGAWHDVVDPERSRMEIVEAFQACISDNALQRKRA